MSLEHTTVEKIAHLARLAIEEQDLNRYARELSKILDLVDQMNAVATDGVVPMAHPLHMIQRLRNDRVAEEDQHTKYQTIAPLTEDGLYLVPKVIE